VSLNRELVSHKFYRFQKKHDFRYSPLPKTTHMTSLKKISLLSLLLSLAIPVAAQQSVIKGKPETGESKALIAEDTTGVQEVETLPLILDKTTTPDSHTIASVPAEPGRITLEDLPEAARYDSLWLKELHEYASLFDDMYDEITDLDTTAVAVKKVTTDELKERLAVLDQNTPFNISYNPSLEAVINSFLVRRKDLFQRMLTASQFYFPMFEEALDKYDLPLEIKYLAIVESALNPNARSRVGATGLWQFMYGTGKMYGLNVSSYVDDRRDPIKATEAACQYLSKLYDIFGDWDLALAAYNSGPGNVNKAIRRSGGYTNYWNIRRNLPRETAGYLPAFLATMYLFNYAQEHDLKTLKVDRPYFETDTLHVKNTITFDQISKFVNVSKEELTMLNPAYKLGIIPKVDGKSYVLRLPKNAIGKFVNNEEAIYATAEEELKSKEAPLPQLVEAQQSVRYRVRSGDYLGKIAEEYGVGVSEIKRWNDLRGNMLRVGQRLTIFPRRPITKASKSTSSGSGNTRVSTNEKIHIVKEGDSLWTISRKYPGITIENLREWNGIRGNNLIPGTKLKLCNCSS
jgi:membrane-bound lytic murein transglycosylase D